ncbi:MAG: hypothetical protein Q7T38_01340 [Gallionella sp.]|nr:hypothetical protein [Gallionella sp.]
MPIEVISALVGALLGAWATYRLALHLGREQAIHARALSDYEALRVAKGKLRAAFAPEIAELRVLGNYRNQLPRPNTANGNVVCDLLSKAYPRHATAVEEFRAYVPPESSSAYQQAWEDCYQNGFEDYDGYDKKGTPFTLFEERVNAILKFAAL